MKTEHSLRLAQVSKGNGKVSKRERLASLKEAQANGVTNLAYLRAHLSLEIAGDDARLARDWAAQEEGRG